MALEETIENTRFRPTLASAGIGVLCMISSLIIVVIAGNVAHRGTPYLSAYGGLPVAVALGILLFIASGAVACRIAGNTQSPVQVIRWAGLGWIMGLLCAAGVALEIGGGGYFAVDLMLCCIGFACYWFLVGQPNPESVEVSDAVVDASVEPQTEPAS